MAPTTFTHSNNDDDDETADPRTYWPSRMDFEQPRRKCDPARRPRNGSSPPCLAQCRSAAELTPRLTGVVSEALSFDMPSMANGTE